MRTPALDAVSALVRRRNGLDAETKHDPSTGQFTGSGGGGVGGGKTAPLTPAEAMARYEKMYGKIKRPAQGQGPGETARLPKSRGEAPRSKLFSGSHGPRGSK